MKLLLRCLLLILPMLGAEPASAHRAWLLPSSTVLSGSDLYVTVDAAYSNNVFGFDFYPLELDHLAVVGPDGAKVTPESTLTGKYRSVFDVPLKAPGTYRLAVSSDELWATYKMDGKEQMWRGSVEELAKIPAQATDISLSQFQRRVETFVTAGKPNADFLKPAGVGLEMQPITHPNDLTTGDQSSFKLLIDGQPAAGVSVAVVKGGLRYRTQTHEVAVTTDAQGIFRITWTEPGMYLIEASVSDKKAAVKEAKERQANYIATLEVLPQ